MATPSLYFWLRTLNTEEINAFLGHLDTPPHQDRRLPRRLMAWLVTHPDAWRQDHPDKDTTEQDLYTHLYPDEPFKAQRLRRLMMELKSILEAYIATQARPPIPEVFDHELRLLNFLLERGANKIFLERIQEFEHHLIHQAPLAPETYLSRMWLEQMRNAYFIHNKIQEDSFEALSEALDIFYLSRKLENFLSLRSWEQQSPQPRQYLFQEQMQSMLNTPQAQTWPLVRLWKSIYDLEFAHTPSQSFEDITAQLDQIKDRLPSLSLRQLRAYLFNYAVRQSDQGTTPYYQRLWHLLHTMLEEGTLHLPDGRLSMPFFLTTVRAACMSGNHPWAAQFIESYHRDLFGDGHHDLIRYCGMLTGFYAGNFKEAWQNLVTFRPKDLRLEVFTRTLQIQLAYELDKDDEFLRQAEAMRKFIQRCESLGQRFISLVLEFVRLSERLGKARFNKGRLPKGLYDEILTCEATEKAWLIAKAQALSEN